MKRFLLCTLLLAALTAAAGEREISLSRDFGTLYGTLLTPDGGARTVVLIIAGSGPTDRNGNNPLGVGGDTYKLLAEALEEAGIASLRYDKRAIGRSVLGDREAIANLTLEDYIADAAALADYLASEKLGQVVLAGHSEGALIALCAAQQSRAVSAVVAISGAGYPLDEIVRLQLARQLAAGHMSLQMEAEGIIAALKRGKRVDMTQHARELYGLFNPGVQSFLISSFAYDPRKEIRKLTLPVLIITGENDLQITPDNADALLKAQSGAVRKIIPGMTHMLKHSDDKTLEGQSRTVYADPSLPLDSCFTATVTRFIRGL